MKRVLMLLVVAGALFLSGCATADYAKYADSTVAMDKEDSAEYVTKIEALTAIAIDPKATDSTKASVAMAIVMLPKGKKRELVAPKDPLELIVPLAGIGLKAYTGWLDLFTFGIDASRSKSAADPDIINRGFTAATVQFGNTK